MDILMYKKTIDFVSLLYKDKNELHASHAPRTKSALPDRTPITDPFPRATPESVGIRSETLLAFLEDLRAMSHLHPHTLMMMTDGKVILEAEFYPYRLDTWHVSHSMAKSITALAIGMLIDEGRLSLDEKLSEIFSKHAFSVDFVRQKDITVRHLLTMTAGVTFNELGSVTYTDWVEGFFSAGVRFTPGTKFMYNSMNSYMLSAIVREKTGEDMFDYLKERLFAPMGITEVFWEKCPKGITKGGWGLYMKTEDLLKFGKLFLDHGAWKGKHLISAVRIHEIIEKHVADTGPMNDHGYGFHVWGSVREGSYQFNGMMGQNLIIFPDLKTVIACYAGNAEMFPKSEFMALVEKHFGGDFHRTFMERQKVRGQMYLERYVRNLSLPQTERRMDRTKKLSELMPLLEKTFVPQDARVSILPLSLCFLHNNYYGTIKKISFRMNGELIEAVFEKEDETVVIPFSPDGMATYFDLRENNEPFAAAAMGKMTKNEDDIPVFKLSIFFTETTSIRHIKFFFYPQKTTVRFSEEPNGIDIYEALRPVLEDFTAKSKAAQKLLNKAEETGLVDYNFEKLFTPEFIVREE